MFVDAKACSAEHMPLLNYEIAIGKTTVNCEAQFGTSLDEIMCHMFRHILIWNVASLDQRLSDPDSFFKLKPGHVLNSSEKTLGQFIDSLLTIYSQETLLKKFFSNIEVPECTLGNLKNNGCINLFLNEKEYCLVTGEGGKLVLERQLPVLAPPPQPKKLILTPETIDEDLNLDWLDARIIPDTTTVAAVLPFNGQFSFPTLVYSLFDRDFEENPSRSMEIPLPENAFPLMESDRSTGDTYIFISFQTQGEAVTFVTSYMDIVNRLPKKTPKTYSAQVWYSFFRTALARASPNMDPHFIQHAVRFDGRFEKGVRAYTYTTDMLEPKNIFPQQPPQQQDVDIDLVNNNNNRRRRSKSGNKKSSRKRSRGPTGRPRGRPPKQPTKKKSDDEEENIKDVEVSVPQLPEEEEEEDNVEAAGDFLEHVLNSESYVVRQQEEQQHQQALSDEWASSDFDSDDDNDDDDEMDVGND